MKTLLLSAVVGLQVLWVGTTVLRQERLRAEAPTVWLEAVSVDPRDLIRGDFVTLGYAFSTLDRRQLEPSPTDGVEPPLGAPVYVELAPAGRFHRLTRSSLQPLSPAPGNVVLQGTVVQNGTHGNPPPRSIRADFGLERFYVREGTGNPTGSLTVSAAVPSNGRAVIRQVFVDDIPYAEAQRSRPVR